MVRPRKQFNRRSEILEAAESLFIDKGFEKTTIDEIAKHIGIGKGTVYLEFKNKNDILFELVENSVNARFEKIIEQIIYSKAPYLPVLGKILANDVLDIFDMATSKVHTHLTMMDTSYRLRKELDYLMEKGRDIITELLEKAAENAEINKCKNFRQVANLIQISLQGFFPQYDLKYSVGHVMEKNLSEYEATRELIRKVLAHDSAIVIQMLIAGLKTMDFVNIKEHENA